jgi:hypothetical protein
MPKLQLRDVRRSDFVAQGLDWPTAIPLTAKCVELTVHDHSQQIYGSSGPLGVSRGVVDYEAIFETAPGRLVTMIGDGKNWFVREESFTVDFSASPFREPDPPPLSQAEAEAQVDELGAQLDAMELPP